MVLNLEIRWLQYEIKKAQQATMYTKKIDDTVVKSRVVAHLNLCIT